MIDDNRQAEIAWPLAPLRREPGPHAGLDTQALRGELVVLGEEHEGFVHARLRNDGYEGWLPAAALRTPGGAFTHRVAVPRTFAFPAPDFKQPPLSTLPLGALLRCEPAGDLYMKSDANEYLIAAHLKPIAPETTDFVAIAETLLLTPYLWGGKSPEGIDCSGLVQLSLSQCGVSVPRDSGPQEREAGILVNDALITQRFQRGDLLFWPGHVAIARGDGTVIHANAHHMQVAIEPAADAISRIAATGTPLRAVKRLAGQ